MARQTRARFVRLPPRTKMWIGVSAPPVVVLASSNTIIAQLSASALLLRPFTILRTRFDCLFSSDQTGASETPFGQFGFGVFTDTASGSAVRMPDPATNPEASWYVHQSVIHEFTFISGVGTQSNGTLYTIDSKAMRKVGPDDDAVMIHAQVAAVGATISALGRTLIQLH